MTHKEKTKLAAKMYHTIFPSRNFYLQKAWVQARWTAAIKEVKDIMNVG